MGAQVCRSDGTFGECICQPSDAGGWEQEQLARINRGMIGKWKGLQRNPWNDPCPCTVTFDGKTYTGHSANESCTVFGWDTNADSPLRTYVVDDVKANGAGMGRIFFIWAADPNQSSLRRLQNVVLSDDLTRLAFEADTSSDGSNVLLQFDLAREP